MEIQAVQTLYTHLDKIINMLRPWSKLVLLLNLMILIDHSLFSGLVVLPSIWVVESPIASHWMEIQTIQKLLVLRELLLSIKQSFSILISLVLLYSIHFFNNSWCTHERLSKCQVLTKSYFFWQMEQFMIWMLQRRLLFSFPNFHALSLLWVLVTLTLVQWKNLMEMVVCCVTVQESHVAEM